jgi:hypothetical protein
MGVGFYLGGLFDPPTGSDMPGGGLGDIQSWLEENASEPLRYAHQWHVEKMLGGSRCASIWPAAGTSSSPAPWPRSGTSMAGRGAPGDGKRTV